VRLAASVGRNCCRFCVTMGNREEIQHYREGGVRACFTGLLMHSIIMVI
jgi:hypothetical protein